MTPGKCARSNSAHSTIRPEASTQGGTLSNKRAHNEHHIEHNGSPGHTQDDEMSADPSMPVADPSAAVAHSKSNPGSSPSQQHNPGPNLNGSTSVEDQVGPPPDEGNDPHDPHNPDADVEGSPKPNLDSNSSGEDQLVPPQDDGDDMRYPDGDVEGGLNSQQHVPGPNGSTPEEDQAGPPPDEGNDPHDPDADVEGGLVGRNVCRQDMQPNDFPGGPNDWNPDDIIPHIDVLCKSVEFINNLHAATLDNDPIPFNVRERLKSPILEPVHIDNVLHYCLDVYLVTTSTHGSEASYDNICKALKCIATDIGTLSHNQLKQKIAKLTGVVPVMTDMCRNSCVAFAGPFAEL